MLINLVIDPKKKIIHLKRSNYETDQTLTSYTNIYTIMQA